MIKVKKTVTTTPVKKNNGFQSFLPKKQSMNPMIKEKANIAHLLLVIHVQKAIVEQPVEEYSLI
jgi:hypothetical protein